MNVQKEARRDAEEMGRALMYYGEGAGTRRKLIRAEVDHKIRTLPGYYDSYLVAAEKQDMVEHAQKARSERRRRDASKTVSKNIKAVARGDSKGLSTPIIIAAVGFYVAHQTGYDKVIYFKAKAKYGELKQKIKNRKQPKPVYNIHQNP